MRGLLEDGVIFSKYEDDRARHVEGNRDREITRSPGMARSSSAGVGHGRYATATVDEESPRGQLERMRSTYGGLPLLHARAGNIEKSLVY